MSTSQTTAPVLEEPGAGLAPPVLFVARRLFFIKCFFGSREAFIRQFESERAKIRQLVDSVPEGKRGTQVLIPRLRGLEDSSRYWSLWMTLDHLRITNTGFSEIVTTLSEGHPFERKISTAAVKPSPSADAATDTAYGETCDAHLETMRTAPNLKSSPEHAHPWFGPLNAYRWLALSATHMAIHRAQIAAIIARL